MQAQEKIQVFDNWITVILLLLLVAIFFLKGLNAERLKTYAFSFFNRGQLSIETEKRISFFKPFYILVFFFYTTIFSLLVFHFYNYQNTDKTDFQFFAILFLITFIYFFIKKLIEHLILEVFKISTILQVFSREKVIYLFTVSLFLYFTLILIQYTELGYNFLFYTSATFFLLRAILIIGHNKNLIFNKLFYFILYLCALEIAPLFVLFKLMLK